MSALARALFGASVAVLWGRGQGGAITLEDAKPAVQNFETMVMVQLHSGVTMQMLLRVRRYALELAGIPEAALCISFDLTNGRETRLGELKRMLNRHNLSVYIHSYTSGGLLSRYPGLRQAYSRIYKLNRRAPVAWGFHTVPILETIGACSGGSGWPRWLWVLEPDVIFTGKLSTLFALYADEPADLISTVPCKRVQPSWEHANALSDTFARRYPLEQRWYSLEFINRQSGRLLATLAAATHEGRHAWSEMLACTVATNNSTLSVRHIDQRLRGTPFTWRRGISPQWANHYEHASFDAIHKKVPANDRNKLYHPVKV